MGPGGWNWSFRAGIWASKLEFMPLGLYFSLEYKRNKRLISEHWGLKFGVEGAISQGLGPQCWNLELEAKICNWAWKLEYGPGS